MYIYNYAMYIYTYTMYMYICMHTMYICMYTMYCKCNIFGVKDIWWKMIFSEVGMDF